jgi:hypothetical protein
MLIEWNAWSEKDSSLMKEPFVLLCILYVCTLSVSEDWRFFLRSFASIKLRDEVCDMLFW